MGKYVVIALVLQVAMVVAGHYNETVLGLSAVLGMGIPLVVAFPYGRDVGAAGPGAKGGLLIGFVGAFVGILIAILLGDALWMLLAFGPISSAVTGALGGAVGGFTRRSTAAAV